MTVGGWCLMVASVGSITYLTAWCFYRVLRAPRVEGHLHAQLDIDTHEEM